MQCDLKDNIFKVQLEDTIKKYYANTREIERIETKYNFLKAKYLEIVKDIEESNINLSSEIKAIDYTVDKIQTSYKASSQEIAIDRAFFILEERKKYIQIELLEIQSSKRCLEIENNDLDYEISTLNEEEQEFLILRYRKEFSYRKISMHMHISESTAWRLKNEILNRLNSRIY